MHHALRRIAIVLLGTLLVSACGDREGGGIGRAGRDKQAVAAAEGRLDILAWPGFARIDGAAPDDRWMRSFEKATACEVHVRRVDEAGQLLSLADKDGIDLLIAPGEIALSLVQAGKVQALDLTRVPAYRGIAPRLANGAWHTADGIHYGVPFQWQVLSLRYDEKAFASGGPLTADLFAERLLADGRGNTGRVRAFTQPIRIADAALHAQAMNPGLAIDDPFALTEGQYAAALDALRQHRALTAGASDDTVVLAGDGPATAKLTATKRADAGIAWSDVAMLHAKAKHPNCAMAWMQWSLQAKTQALAAASFDTLPVVAAACEQNDAVVADTCRAPAFVALASMHFQRTPVARCGKGQCVPYSRWVRDFHALDSATESPPTSGPDATP